MSTLDDVSAADIADEVEAFLTRRSWLAIVLCRKTRLQMWQALVCFALACGAGVALLHDAAVLALAVLLPVGAFLVWGVTR